MNQNACTNFYIEIRLILNLAYKASSNNRLVFGSKSIETGFSEVLTSKVSAFGMLILSFVLLLYAAKVIRKKCVSMGPIKKTINAN